MMVAMSESLQGGIIDDQIATTLLMGIVASTDRFTAAHTTSKSLTVAAQMMAAGARQQAVVKALYRDNKGGDGRSDGRTDGRGERGDRQQREGGRDDRRDGKPSAQSAGRDGGRSEGRNNERPERNNGDRNDRNDRSERREQPVREPQSASERQPAQEAEVATPQASQAPTQINPEDMVVMSEPMGAAQPEQNQRPKGMELPIIDPGHIEMSEPDEAPEQVAQEPEANMPPMADFAAAAEILAHHNDENENENDK